jgi:hypothetical protein
VSRLLTIVGGGRDASSNWRRGSRVVIFGAVGIAVAVLVTLGPQFLRYGRYRASAAKEQSYTPNPANDTEIICAGWDAAELGKILEDFTQSYADRLGASAPFRTERLSPNEYRIAFPNDIPPTLLSFLVNYVQYPKGFDLATHQIAVVAHVTLTASFPTPREGYVGQRARIYVPSNVRRYDLVYFAVGPDYFEQSFTDMAWKSVEDGRVSEGVRALW